MECIDIKMSGAAADLVWLLDRGYPKKPALDLVGNRHSLDRLLIGRLFGETPSETFC